jgi:hypothetical protein
MCYHGPIDIDLVSFFSNYMKQNIKANSIVISRIYRVLIELMQNVSYYSADQYYNDRKYGSGIGWFRLDEQENAFVISSGNRIFSKHGPVLEKNCNEINTLSEEGLRELKRNTRRQASVRDIGAHIGLIQAGLLTGNKLDLEIKAIDKIYSFFTISAKVNKVKTDMI